MKASRALGNSKRTYAKCVFLNQDVSNILNI